MITIARIKDIAEQANVSTATVSRILSNDPSLSVSVETRQRVLDIVSELNYVPGRRKKALTVQEKETYSIGLILTNDEAADPYFMSMRLGVEDICEPLGVKIAAVFHAGKSVFAKDTMEGLDGLIVLGDVNSEELRSVYASGSVVYVDFQPVEENCDSDVVITDFEIATRKMLDVLLEAGHTRIAYIGGKGQVKSIHGSRGRALDKEDVRALTYERVMREKGLYAPENMLIGDFGPMSGYTLMKRLIGRGSLPTAAVIASDPMAIGAMKALNEAAVRVPDDIAIFSFDDIEAAAFLSPALSTVKVHTEEMGRTAVKLLVDRFRNGRTLPLKVTLPSELVIRESAGPIPYKGGQR